NSARRGRRERARRCVPSCRIRPAKSTLSAAGLRSPCTACPSRPECPVFPLETPMRRLFAPLLLLAGLGTAHAYPPEPGLWWNPNASGSGFTLELQDNLLAFTGYLGETNGAPVWYTSAGLMSGNALYEGRLFRFQGS